jgi:hypothetical protein
MVITTTISAIQGKFYTKRLRSSGFDETNDLQDVLNELRDHAYAPLSELLSNPEGFKVKLAVTWMALIPTKDEPQEFHLNIGVIDIQARNPNVTTASRYADLLRECRRRILDKIDEVAMKSSGVALLYIKEVELQFAPNRRMLRAEQVFNMRGGTYQKLPKELEAKKAVLNIKSQGNQCFQYCLTAAISGIYKNNPNANLPGTYEQNSDGSAKTRGRLPKGVFKVLVPCGLDFSMLDPEQPVDSVTDIDAFEEANEISVYVFAWTKAKGGFYIPTSIRKPTEVYKTEVNLLLYGQHYCLITDLDRLMNTTQDDVMNEGHSKKWCNRCFAKFRTSEELEAHKNRCKTDGYFETQKVSLPKPIDGNPPIKCFNRPETAIFHPCVVYADFETYFDEGVGVGVAKCSRVASYAYTTVGREYEVPKKHEAFLSVDDGTKDMAEDFVMRIASLATDYRKTLKNFEDEMHLTEEDKRTHKFATQCYLCGKTGCTRDGAPESLKLVRDHCHITGKYRGPACVKCNARATVRKKIVCFFHNLGGFDGNIILHAIKRLRNKGHFEKAEPEVIKKTAEKMLSFSFAGIQFVDSFAFKAASLEKMIESMRKARPTLKEAFPAMHKHHPLGGSERRLNLLLRKVPFPYSSMRGPECFSGPAILPREAYTNDLSGEPISDAEFRVLHKVVDMLDEKTFRGYHDVYLWTDVLALRDCMEAFRDTFHETDGLDLAHYLSLPSVAHQSMLKLTKAQIELISEVNGGMALYDDVTAGIRGGLACMFQPYARANNPMMPDYDQEQPTSWILYVDANSLYPTQMCKPVPTRDYELLGELGLDEMNRVMDEWSEESDKGYYFVVDWCVPDDLHDYLDLAPIVKLKVTDLTETQQHYASITGSTVGTEKLIPYLGAVEEQRIHVSLLKVYRELGVKVTKCHRAWRFTQEAFMKGYIEERGARRAASKDELVRESIKLGINSNYGKLCENPENRTKYELCTTFEDWLRHASKPNCVDFSVISEEDGFLGGVHIKTRNGVVLKSPRWIGQTILDYAKAHMFRFHYGVMKQYRAQLLFTDTDSFMYKIECPDLREHMLAHLDYYDMSAWPGHKENKGRLGYFKYEATDKQGNPCFISEFVGLRAKMYSIVMHPFAPPEAEVETSQVKKAKGLPKQIKLKHQAYLNALFDPEKTKVSFRAIRSIKNEPNHIQVDKAGLSAFDDKTFRISTTESRPHGHYLNRTE